MAVDKTSDAALTIEWARGDSSLREFTVVGVDISGFTFLFTVNTVRDPSVSPAYGTQMFQLAGTVVDGPTGRVAFTPSAVNTNIAIGQYYYDIQMTDGSARISTIVKGICNILQDITK